MKYLPEVFTGPSSEHVRALLVPPVYIDAVVVAREETHPCLPDRTNGRSPVRGKYTHTYPCLLDRTNGRSPVREKYTRTHSCLPDSTNG